VIGNDLVGRVGYQPGMAGNGRKFAWTGRKERAAQLLAEDELSDAEIARQAGVSERQLYRWKAHPEFAGRLRELAARSSEHCRRYAIARKGRRVRALDERWQALQQARTSPTG
jgi:transposase-like protein